jgi:hypothetical protein
MPTETYTVYGVRSTQVRHGKRKVVVETAPGHETDCDWHVQLVEQERAWQKSVGLTPDAELAARTVTTSDWYGI